jgi:hypothetical protein
LEQHPLEKPGPLQLSSTGLPEGGPAFFDHDSNGNLILSGPFNHSNDNYTASIQQRMQYLKIGEVASLAPVEDCLAYRNLLDSLVLNELGPIFLRHVDSRDVNFLVDDEYYTTRIINWELAISIPKGSAF